MAWERRPRADGMYFYDARRVGPKVVKVYLGSGAAAQAAARAVAERRGERERAARAAAEADDRTRGAEALIDRLYTGAMAHATAVLYAAGYWRPSRHG